MNECTEFIDHHCVAVFQCIDNGPHQTEQLHRTIGFDLKREIKHALIHVAVLEIVFQEQRSLCHLRVPCGHHQTNDLLRDLIDQFHRISGLHRSRDPTDPKICDPQSFHHMFFESFIQVDVFYHIIEHRRKVPADDLDIIHYALVGSETGFIVVLGSY